MVGLTMQMRRTANDSALNLRDPAAGSGPDLILSAYRAVYSPLVANPTGSNPGGLTSVLTGVHIAFRSFVLVWLINNATL